MQVINRRIIFKTPSVLTPQTVKYFLKEVEPLFSMVNKTVPNVLFDAYGLEKAGLLGHLLIYKFMEFSFKKRCFLNPTFSIKEDIFNEFKKTGFQKLVLAFVNDKKKDFGKLKYEEENGIFIAPINLANFEKGDGQDLYAPQIRDYYVNLKVAFIVTLCMSEIAANYSAHAEDDTNSILVAKGNHSFFEIACADNGIGIVSSLRPTLREKCTSHEVMEMAMQRGVTSKHGTDHMGFGLWLVNEMVSMLKGELFVFSEHACYINRQGRIKKGESDYWRGTITYVRLPLGNSKAIEAIYEKFKKRFNRIKIQRV